MKRMLMIVLAMLLVAGYAFAQTANPPGQGNTLLNGGIVTPAFTPFPGAGPNPMTGNPNGLGRHDLQEWNTSSSTSNGPLGCETCHLPHTAPKYGKSFLWAWTYLPGSNLPTYASLYNPSGYLASPPTGVTGNSRSMLCFSCHDAYSVGANGITANNIVSGAGLPYQLINSTTGSPALTTQHPVDAEFPPTNDYVQPALVTSYTMYGANGQVGADNLPVWFGGATPGTGLSALAVECGTCHDVHNDYPVGFSKGIGGPPFLRVANTNGTYLCRECHNAQ